MNKSDSESVSETRCMVTGLTIAVASLLVAIVGTVLTGWLADLMQWNSVGSWALLHGSGVIVLMAWGLLGFHLVNYLRGHYQAIASAGRYGLLPHLVYISAGLASYNLSDYFLWLATGLSLLAVVLAKRGVAVKPFGLVLVGLLVTSVYLYLWIYMNYFFPIPAH